MSPENRLSWVWILPVLFISCVTFAKFLDFSGPVSLPVKKGYPLLFLSWSVTSVTLPSAPLLQRETKHLPKNRVKVQVGNHRNCYWVPESSRPHLGKDLQFWQKKNDSTVTVIWSGLGRNRGRGGLPGSEECKWGLDSQYETAGKIPVQPFSFSFFF